MTRAKIITSKGYPYAIHKLTVVIIILHTNIAAAFVSSIIYIAIVLYVIIKQYKSEKVLFS